MTKKLQSSEEMKADQDALRRITVRAMDLEDAGFEDEPGWRANLYIWVAWNVWHERLRPGFRVVGRGLWEHRMFWLGCVGATLAALKLFLG